MRKLLYGTLGAVFMLAVGMIDPAHQSPPASASDSCPAASFVRGYDDSGNAICGHVTGCPYGDSIPLGARCDDAGAQQQATRNIETAPAATVSNGEVFTGK